RPYTLKTEELAWAYITRTTHRTNGIKTGTSFTVNVFAMDGKLAALSAAKEADANTIMAVLHQVAPFARKGFDKEWEKEWRKDNAAFISAVRAAKNAVGTEAPSDESSTADAAGAAPVTEPVYESSAAAAGPAESTPPEPSPVERSSAPAPAERAPVERDLARHRKVGGKEDWSPSNYKGPEV
ncbi:hypothetical protein LJC32_06435, partial [Oscillospiraceae bacterium OttesenSCG-928-F05]|nr:hypothetical protein [Oscillospiraceae bacterium OttesenSCG-928-F05]